MPADPRRVKDLFVAALDLPDPAARSAFLDRECGADADAELRHRLDVLLAAHDEPASALERPLAEADPAEYAATLTASEQTASHHAPIGTVGAIVAGKYKLLQQIGEGGMGTVWMADQLEPVKRRVAVKLIRAERGNSATILARFEAERQAIALMDHPHIAKLLDAGTTDGAPYFVMELVKGIPLTEYCDTHRLSIPERLNLFMQICSAVQHAHQKGIIHRDLKPTNILVESHDGKPVPKVIDFGLAKATSGLQLTEHTLFTGFGSVMGTPLYMAPEQATFNAIDIDTRADVYALGVILYELLTGTTPLTREEIKKVAFEEMLRLIREQESPTPSKRLSSTDSKPSIAANRQTEPAKLGRFVKGELDWIVMKALSKDRDRRYETANGFAKDVERFLAHEPVLAGPPSVGYKLRKFVRRNRGPVIASSLVLFALIAGVIGTTLGLLEARRQTEFAQKQEGLARDEAAAKELARAEEAVQRKRAVEFRDKALDALRSTTSTDVEQLIGGKTELGANEKAYLEAIAKRWQAFAVQEGTDEQARAIRAEGHYRVAYLWQKLGQREEARPEHEQAFAIREKLAADFPAVPGYRGDLAVSHISLGNLLSDLGKQAEAEVQYNKALVIQEKLAADFPAVPDYRRELAVSHNSLGALLSGLGKRAEAEEQYKKAFAIREKLAADFPAVPDYRSDLSRSHNNLGILLSRLGKQAEAEEQFKKSHTIREKLAADFPAVPGYRSALGTSHNNLGILLSRLGKQAEAEEQFKKAITIQEKLAADFPAVPGYRIDLGGSYGNFGTTIRKGGRANESLGWFDKAIGTLTPVHRAEPRDVTAKQVLWNSHWSRAQAYDQLQKYAEAVKDWDRAVELSQPAEQAGLRASRATSRLQAGMVAEAVAEVAELTKSPNWNAGQWYDFACIYAVVSGKIADKKQEYADRAMELLTKAVKAGYNNTAHLKQDADLDPLRGRADFRKLLADLAAKFPPPPEPAPPPRAVR